MGPTLLHPAPAASWYVDPLGRHEYRYWNGLAWTEHAADGGQQLADPLAAAVAAVIGPALPGPAEPPRPSIVCSTLARRLQSRRVQFAQETFDETALQPFLLAGTEAFPEHSYAPMGVDADDSTREIELRRATLAVGAAIAFVRVFVLPAWPHPALAALLGSLPTLSDARATGSALEVFERFESENGKARTAWRQGHLVWREGRMLYGGQASGAPVPAAGSGAWRHDVDLDQALGALHRALSQLLDAQQPHAHEQEERVQEPLYLADIDSAEYFTTRDPSEDAGDLGPVEDSIRHACFAVGAVDSVASHVIQPPVPEFPILLALLRAISSLTLDELAARLVEFMPPPSGPPLRRCASCGTVARGHPWDRCTGCHASLGASWEEEV